MIMSRPCRSSTTNSLGKLCVLNPKVMFLHTVFAGIFPSVELTLMGLLSPQFGILFLLTKSFDMKECVASESKDTNAGYELIINSPIIGSGYPTVVAIPGVTPCSGDRKSVV